MQLLFGEAGEEMTYSARSCSLFPQLTVVAVVEHTVRRQGSPPTFHCAMKRIAAIWQHLVVRMRWTEEVSRGPGGQQSMLVETRPGHGADRAMKAKRPDTYCWTTSRQKTATPHN